MNEAITKIASVDILLRVNGVQNDVSIKPWRTLLEVLRETLALIGTKRSCGEGQCGACTVLVDGKPINSCLYLAVEAHDREILTIEGPVDGDPALEQIQQSFVEKGAIQCGFCTPGMILSAKSFLATNPSPSEQEVRKAIAGNLCRCTGYDKIVKSIMSLAGGA